MSGIGWAMGLERLILACEAEGIELAEERPLDATSFVWIPRLG